MDWNLFWTAFGAIGGTVGALSTTAAVIVALWQTKYSQRKNIKLVLDNTIHVFNGSITIKCIGITATNTGIRDVIINSWGIKYPKGKLQFITEFEYDPFFSKINKKLPQTVKRDEALPMQITTEMFKKQLEYFISKGFINKNKRILFYVCDSTNKYYYIKTHKKAKEYLKEKQEGEKQ